MKTKYLLIPIVIAVLSSCSSAYRTTQTPDDVYYSPAPPPPVEYVTSDNQQDKDTYGYNNNISEDLAIRRGINDPRYRNLSLDPGYGYSPYDYGYSPYNYYGSSFFSPYPSYYNPYAFTGVTFYPYYGYYNYYTPYYNYYYPVYFSKYGSAARSNYPVAPRTFNLGVYNNNSRYGHPGVSNQVNSAPVRTFQAQSNNNRGNGVGNFIRRVFEPSNNARSSGNDNNGNYNSSPRGAQGSGSGSSSSSGSSSAPVRTFR